MHRILLPIAFASGFAALAYEVVWQRLLAFFSGADVYSVTVTVAAFMAGLGAGSLAGGHLADRLGPRRSLLAFGLSQLSIAGFALGSVWLYYDVLYARYGRLASSPLVMIPVLFLTLFWPTFFMGVCLPLLSKASTDDASLAAHRIGSLYGYNTLGAAIAPVLALGVLARAFGLGAVVRIAAGINLACALALITLGPAQSLKPVEARDRAGSPPVGIGVWILAYFVSGFVALSLEIVWFRLLEVILKSNTFTFAILLAFYLSGVGLGSLFGRGLASRSGRPGYVFFLLQAGIPVYAALSLTLFVAVLPNLTAVYTLLGSPGPFEFGEALLGAREVFNPASDAASQRGPLLVVYLLLPLYLLGPPTLMMGASFSFLQKAVQTDLRFLGRWLGWLQASNIGGSTVGALVTGLGLLGVLGCAGTLRLLLGFALFFVWLARPLTSGRIVSFLAAVPVMAFFLVPRASTLWSDVHGAPPRRVIAAEDETGVSVLRRHGPKTEVFIDGVSLSALPYGGIHTILGALPAAIHPEPVRVAIIGLGSGDTLYAVGARRETRTIECVEILRPQIRTLRLLDAQGIYPGLAALLLDPRIHLTHGDGRKFLLATNERFDVIEADALLPHATYSGNLYSREYFSLVLSRLRPAGLAVTWSPTRRTRRTFLGVFPHVLIFGAGELEVLLGSPDPIGFDPARVLARVRESADYYSRGGVDIEKILSPVLSQPPLAGGSVGTGDINTDLFPRDEYAVPEAPR